MVGPGWGCGGARVGIQHELGNPGRAWAKMQVLGQFFQSTHCAWLPTTSARLFSLDLKQLLMALSLEKEKE